MEPTVQRETVQREGAARPAEKPLAQRSLYERLGGRETIQRIIDDLLELHLSNPIISPRFAAVEDKETMGRHAVEFFCAGTGGTETYSGADMISVHTGMNISEQEFVAVLDDFMIALQRNGVGQAEQNEVLAILYGMKAEIVHL